MYKNPIRYKVTNKSVKEDQQIFNYNFKGNEDIPSMTFIDTRGLGDTNGIEQDLKNFEAMKTYIQTRIGSTINTVCFVVKAENFALTEEFVYSC